MDPMAKVMFIMSLLMVGVLFIARVLDFFLRKFFLKSRQQDREAQNHLLSGLQQQLQQEMQKRREDKREEASLPPPMPAPWGMNEGVQPFIAQDVTPEQVRAEKQVYREPGTLMQNQLETYREELAARQRKERYERQRRAEEARIRREEEQAYLRQAKIPGAASQTAPIKLTPAKMREAVILSEVLGKPKAYRRGRR